MQLRQLTGSAHNFRKPESGVVCPCSVTAGDSGQAPWVGVFQAACAPISGPLGHPISQSEFSLEWSGAGSWPAPSCQSAMSSQGPAAIFRRFHVPLRAARADTTLSLITDWGRLEVLLRRLEEYHEVPQHPHRRPSVPPKKKWRSRAALFGTNSWHTMRLWLAGRIVALVT
jgi:hypothetical protein